MYMLNINNKNFFVQIGIFLFIIVKQEKGI